MLIYYKYCTQLGSLKILGNSHLKIPYISDVNDPLDCRSAFILNKDLLSSKEYLISMYKLRGEVPAPDFDNRFKNLHQSGELQKNMEAAAENAQCEWNKKASLLSVSKDANKTVMWTHYGEKHCGVVIGFNFDQLEIKLHQVDYSSKRPTLTLLANTSDEDWAKCLLTKSDSWDYEKEYRTIFVETSLRQLEAKGLACIKEFEGKKTWFLIIQPGMVKEIIFGLNTDEDLKASIRKLAEKHPSVKYFQTEISNEIYDLKLTPID